MAPNAEAENIHYLGSLGIKKPVTGVTFTRKSGDIWLDGKRIDDGAEGYWRIHDGLYDLTNFIKQHPGGPQWLELTKGTDITEAFEVHHIKGVAENLLEKFYVKKAETPRIPPYTFKDDGFYRTLKRNVREELKKIPKKAITISSLYTDFLMVSTFVFSILACRFWNYWLAIVAGYFLASVTVAAHNYFHRKDNFRMYYFNLSLFNYREWRISHSLSHHLFTNTIIDLEMLFLQPYIEYFPRSKGFIKTYFSWIYAPLLWFLTFHLSLYSRILDVVKDNDTRSFDKSDFVPYSLPLLMYVLGSQSLLHTILMWTVIVCCGSFYFSFVGLNAAHHHPKIFHDGDTPSKETDWGILQLDAVVDRNEITGSHYLVLTNFGDHALHHMFPTLDQGLLHQIYPVFKKTLEQFNVDFRMTSQLELIKGQFQQLSRNKPNPNPPSSSWTKQAN